MADFCLWYRYYSFPDFTKDMYTTEHINYSERNIELAMLRYYKFCPYCGKRIKVKSNETLINNNYHIEAEIDNH